MVNYCCVEGCSRNNRQHKHLNFYGLPKEKERQTEWLKAAGREDLLQKTQSNANVVSYRFCSRHFSPACLKNRHLREDAIPTLCLPGDPAPEGNDEEPQVHQDIICDNCESRIYGFRYKCVTCKDYDLCQKCEMLETHSEHYMLRLPKPLKFKLADDLIQRWKKFFQMEHVTPDNIDSCGDIKTFNNESSDDDVPITRYVQKQQITKIDLTEDIKAKIRKEVARVLNKKKSTNKNKRKTKADDEKRKDAKRQRYDEAEVKVDPTENPRLEVVFADVDEIKDNTVEVKYEPFCMLLPPATVPNADQSLINDNWTVYSHLPQK